MFVMMRVLWAILLLAASPALALPVTTAAGNPTIVVGIIATMSGSGAVAGQDSVDGFTTGLRQMGGRFANQEVRVVVVDDRGSPDTAIQVTRRLLEREKVDFVLTAVSQPSFAAIIKPLLDSRLFVINLDGAPSAMLGAECNPSLFQMGATPEAVNEAAGQYFAAEKMRRVVVVGPDTPATASAVSAIKRNWTGEIVDVLRVKTGALLFKPELARIRELAPDMVYTVVSGGMGSAFVREYSSAGLKADIPLLGTWTSFERPMLPGMGDHGLEVLNIAPWSPDLETPLNKRMISDFELEYGRPTTSWVAQGYDAALLLESAMKATSGRTTDREAVRHGLRRTEFAPVRGTFRFDTNHGPSINLYLRRVIRDAKGRFTEELRGVVIKDWHGRDVAQCPMRWVEEPLVQPGKPGAAPAQSPRPTPVPGAKPPKKPGQ